MNLDRSINTNRGCRFNVFELEMLSRIRLMTSGQLVIEQLSLLLQEKEVGRAGLGRGVGKVLTKGKGAEQYFKLEGR